MKLQEHVPLAPYTTLGVGGAARFFALAETIEDIRQALAFARERALPLFPLGGGSNVVIADDGFDGLVIMLRVPGITSEVRGGKELVTAGAGVVWDDMVVWAIGRGLHGLEYLSGVPGTVGGAVVANLGAYGAQCSDTFLHAEVLDTCDGELKIIRKEACGFAYHDSVFSHAPGRHVVVRATFALSADAAAMPSYRDNRFDLKRLSGALARAPSMADIRNAVLDMREEKGLLIMHGRPAFKSAGSFFHMPFVSEETYTDVGARARRLDAEKEERLRPWAWKQEDGLYKIAPGFLLEYTEFQKGYVRGGAGISPRHTLSIINVANASARDIANLARDMRNAVEEIFDIRLEREVEHIGNIF